eukprot:CAMPEP_0119471788 /NCGR_PEP_ID=MMETSP1344-20130328/4115_1 /TAXON_ID=236787 /ORGANISM="Florenciella parvula, Strain CCMP2471" /LENGTH=184 /DNA_ID=CAMNT_0007504625 /DNA_START=75 /DNA_END=630 /DNA_ORIENTATION=-
MAQDPIQYQPAFSCTELALFEASSLSQGITPAFFVASSQSSLFLLPKQVWSKIALVISKNKVHSGTKSPSPLPKIRNFVFLTDRFALHHTTTTPPPHAQACGERRFGCRAENSDPHLAAAQLGLHSHMLPTPAKPTDSREEHEHEPVDHVVHGCRVPDLARPLACLRRHAVDTLLSQAWERGGG